VAYCETLITEPRQTIFLLLSDLFEGGNQAQLVRRIEGLVASGVKVISLLALADHGAPAYDESLARKFTSLGVPCFACTPNQLPELIAAALRGADLMPLATTKRDPANA
jgi:hypothetical protein